MRKATRLLTIALTLLCCSGMLFASSTVVIGGPPNSANCIPWSCQSQFPGNYAQTYLGTAFNTGPISISDIEFYNTFFNNGPNQSLASMNFNIYLATVSNPVPDGTLPAGATLFFTGSLNGQVWPFGQTLTFNGTPFNYNPANGNLEMYVSVSNNSGGSIPVYFDAAFNGNISRWCPDCGSNAGYGLVTGFSYGPAVPEPASLFLLGTGLLGLGGMIRKKK